MEDSKVIEDVVKNLVEKTVIRDILDRLKMKGSGSAPESIGKEGGEGNDEQGSTSGGGLDVAESESVKDPNGDTLVDDMEDEEDESPDDEEEYEDEEYEDPSVPSCSYRPRIVPKRKRLVRFAKNVHQQAIGYTMATRPKGPGVCLDKVLGEEVVGLKGPNRHRYKTPPRITKEQIDSAVVEFREKGGKSSSEVPNFYIPEPFPRGCGKQCKEGEECGRRCECRRTDLPCSNRNGCRCSKTCSNRLQKREPRNVSQANENWKDLSYSDNSTLKSASNTSLSNTTEMHSESMRTTVAQVVREMINKIEKAEKIGEAQVAEEPMNTEEMNPNVERVCRKIRLQFTTGQIRELPAKSQIQISNADFDDVACCMEVFMQVKAKDLLQNDAKRLKLTDDECGSSSGVESRSDLAEVFPKTNANVDQSELILPTEPRHRQVDDVAIPEQEVDRMLEEDDVIVGKVKEKEVDSFLIVGGVGRKVTVEEDPVEISGGRSKLLAVLEEIPEEMEVENEEVGSEIVDVISSVEDVASIENEVETDETSEINQIEDRLDDSDIVQSLLIEMVQSVEFDLENVEDRVEMDVKEAVVIVPTADNDGDIMMMEVGNVEDGLVDDVPVVDEENEVEGVKMDVDIGEVDGADEEVRNVVDDDDDQEVVAEIVNELVDEVVKMGPVPLRRSTRLKRPIDRFSYDADWIKKRRRYSNRVPNPTPVVRRPRVPRPPITSVVFTPRIRQPLLPPPPVAVIVPVPAPPPNAAPQSNDFLDAGEKSIEDAILKLEKFNYGTKAIDVLMAIQRISTTSRRLRNSQNVSDEAKSRYLRAVARMNAML